MEDSGDSSVGNNGIPVVDLREPDEEKLVKSISEAAREWGFFQAVNHGVPAELITNLQAVGTEFFVLPQAEKEAYAKKKNKNDSIEGYGTKLSNSKSSWGEHLFHKIWPPSAIDYSFWPKKPSSYRQANEEYGRRVREAVVEKVLKCLSLGLGLEGHVLKESVGGDEIVHMMKINYYPPCPNDNNNNNSDDKDTLEVVQLGVPAHTDMGNLTILVPNQVPGLQILKDRLWIDVDYIPSALVLHIGDQIQIASNGHYKSVMHRSTVDKEKTRMSWPLFLEPPSHFVVGPIPQQLNHKDKDKDKAIPKYHSMTFKDYAFSKLNTTTKLIN